MTKVKLRSLERVLKEQSKDYFKGKLSPKAEQLHQTILSLAYNLIIPQKTQLKKLAKDEKHLRHFLLRIRITQLKPQLIGNLQKVADSHVENATELCEYVKLLSDEHQTLNLIKSLKESVLNKASQQQLKLNQPQQQARYQREKLAEFKRKVNQELKFKKSQIDYLLQKTRDAEMLLNEQKKELENLRDVVQEERTGFDKQIECSQNNGMPGSRASTMAVKKLSHSMVLQKRDTIEDDDDQPDQLTDFD